jgi:molybdate transport system substrate-binding protein
LTRNTVVKNALAAAALVCAAAAGASADEAIIAAASDLQAVFPAVTDRYQRETGHAVRLTFGSSGNFFSQIQNGAPFDLFFSADIDYPKRLAAAGLADPATLYEYAVGKIVLWARKGSTVDLGAGLAGLTDPRVRRIAIANPAHAPYGRAAVAALRHERVYDAVRGKLVLGENVSQAAQFVESGNADVGIVALSIARTPALQAIGISHDIPVDYYPPIAQAAVILNRSSNRAVALDFLRFLARPEVLLLMREFGFTPPSPVR